MKGYEVGINSIETTKMNGYVTTEIFIELGKEALAAMDEIPEVEPDQYDDPEAYAADAEYSYKQYRAWKDGIFLGVESLTGIKCECLTFYTDGGLVSVKHIEEPA